MRTKFEIQGLDPMKPDDYWRVLSEYDSVALTMEVLLSLREQFPELKFRSRVVITPTREEC